MLNVLQFLSYFMIFSIEFINCNISTTEKTCMTRPYVERWEKEYYPNPQNVIQEDYCGRGCKPSWICDPGHVITKEKADVLEQKIENIRILCGCSTCRPGIDGFIVSVALVPNLYTETGQDRNHIENVAEKFLNYLRNTTWQFGSCNDDVIILLSAEQKMVRLVAGKTVRSIIPKGCLSDIQNDASDNLMAGGIVFDILHQMIIRLGHAFKHKTCDSPDSEDSSAISYNITIIIIVAAVVLLIVVMLISVYLKRQGHCKRMQTYRIKFPAMALHIRKPHKHRHKHTSNHESDEEMTSHMKPAESRGENDMF